MAPDLSATFVPSGFDDYYMPEVVSPAPQRYAASLVHSHSPRAGPG